MEEKKKEEKARELKEEEDKIKLEKEEKDRSAKMQEMKKKFFEQIKFDQQLKASPILNNVAEEEKEETKKLLDDYDSGIHIPRIQNGKMIEDEEDENQK